MNTITSDLSLNHNASDFAKTIFNFVKEKKYDVYTSGYNMQRDIIDTKFYQDYIQDRKETIIQELEDMNFYENEMFENANQTNHLAQIQKILDKFQIAILSIFLQGGKIPKGIGSTTSADSPLPKKLGNNKLDIKPTGRDYGLLFI